MPSTERASLPLATAPYPHRPLEMRALCPRPLCQPQAPDYGLEHSDLLRYYVLSPCLKVLHSEMSFRCLLLDILVWQHSWTLARQLFLSLLSWSYLSISNRVVPHVSACPSQCIETRIGSSTVASSHRCIQLVSCPAYDHGVTGEFRFPQVSPMRSSTPSPVFRHRLTL